MSREHLYKAKRVNWRELPKEEWWVYGMPVKHGSCLWMYTGEINIIELERDIYGNPYSDAVKYEVGPETVCEYTGLTDRNGRKIFENDIVGRYSKYRKEWDYGVVKYGEFNCSCCSGVYGWYFDDEDIRDCDMYEVRGNIFDNPELLKGGEAE